MASFHYRALNAAGQTVTGSVEAANLTMVENNLRAVGIWLLEAKEGAGATAPTTGISRIKIGRSDLISFFVQMSLLLRAGITLPTALKRLAEDFEGTKLGIVVADLHEKVTIGTPFNQAMAHYPRVFSTEVMAIVQAGEVSGRLPEVFESLNSYYEWLDGLIGEVRQALIYPIMVMSAASALVMLLFTLVVPKFVTLLNDLHLQVPMITRVVMAISEVMVHYWPVVAGVAVGGPILLKLALKSDQIGRAFDRMLMRLPIFGVLIAMFALSRFTRNLGMLYRAGIPLLRALEICRNVVGNRAIAGALDEVRTGVLEGTPLSKGLAKHDIFPQTLVTMIATGESSGTLDTALNNVADYYNKIIPRRIKIVFSIFDPVMMVSLIAVVGTVALAVILPILQLWNAR